VSAAARRVLIVGASAAGLAAAEALRRADFPGEIVLLGEETHPPYDRPPLSKQILAGEWEVGRLPLRADERLVELRLDLRLGVTATGLDLAAREVRLADDTSIGYDDLVIATGVRPRRLPGEGAHVLRTLGDALALRERLGAGTRLVVVGAGFLGAEAAAVARGLGAQVTALEPAQVPLAHAVGAQVGEVIAGVHRDNGVDLRTGVGVEAIVPGGVLVAGGEVVPADEVLVAIGALPNTEWLEGSGLTIENGVVCDEYCAAAPGVYAAGDVARWYNPLFGESMRIEHRTNAAEQGMAAARNLLEPEAAKPFAPVPYFWSDQYDMKIQSYGYLRGHEEIAIVEGSLAERRFLAVYRTGDRVAGVLGVNVSPKAIRPWRQAIATRAPWSSVDV
jgi:NADPH-dependent 2,4-dienoyl-CoA reductase/sulfur reductase-like enzyme